MEAPTPPAGREERRSGPTVVFDVIGTLFSLEGVRAELVRLGAPGSALELWFGQALRDFFALSHAGGYAPLRSVLEAALPRALSVHGIGSVRAADVSAIVGAFAQLEPAPGAVEACARLRAKGVRLVALSNGSLENTESLLDGGGLRESFDAVHSCDEVETSKPAPAVYELACRGADREGTFLVAAHAWDCAGATLAGLRAVWVAGVESEYLAALPQPHAQAADLSEAAGVIARGL